MSAKVSFLACIIRLNITTSPQEDRARGHRQHAQIIGQVRTTDSQDMRVDRHTDRHVNHNTSLPHGEQVKNYMYQHYRHHHLDISSVPSLLFLVDSAQTSVD